MNDHDEQTDAVKPTPPQSVERLRALPDRRGEDVPEGTMGRTMFDGPSSEDGTITVLLPNESLRLVPTQSLLRVHSPDDRTYLGIVVSGPFAEADGLRSDAPGLVNSAVRGASFVPPYHGRLRIELLGEDLGQGKLAPPRFRPLPNSPVTLLDASETAAVLNLSGDLRLGLLAGDDIEVRVPSDRKSVLPRHTGVLGTTGGGKSTTVSRLMEQAVAADCAVILLDTEGEYTQLNEPTDDQAMIAALTERGIAPAGIDGTRIYRLVGKETTNEDHPDIVEFSPRFESLSPYAVEEIIDLNEAQKDRFRKAYDTTKLIMRDLGLFPTKSGKKVDPDEDREAMELNEFDRGYPRMRLEHLLDVATLIMKVVAKEDPDEQWLLSDDIRDNRDAVMQRVNVAAQGTSNRFSWQAVLGRLWRVWRLRVFDQKEAAELDFEDLLSPGRLSIFDLSDTDSPALNNLVITDILRGAQKHQDDRYREAERGEAELTRAIIVIEEAHEFLSDSRIKSMPNLFEQVSRIAKRGRKRWLGLVFVTQLPQHLPRQVLGLVNNFVLHKMTDADTISKLRRTVAGIDDSLWKRLPALAPGQAIVSFTSHARPLLVAIDPTPAKLRMID